MKNYDVVLFDLDGTLTEPAEGITNSLIYALKKFGIEVADRRELYKFIGPPLVDGFQEFYGFSPEKAMLATQYYREYFADKGLFENRVYEGVEDMLSTLKSAGKKLVLATSKPQPFAERILKKFNLYFFFDYVCGATMDEGRTHKDEVIAYILKEYPCEKLRTVMVGDREHDVMGARMNGIDCIGVLYGYGSRQELEIAGATQIAEKVEDVLGFLM